MQRCVMNSILSSVDLQVRSMHWVGEFVHERMCRHVKCVKMPVVIFHGVDYVVRVCVCFLTAYMYM